MAAIGTAAMAATRLKPCHGSAEATELAKLAETTYRDVNIGLANQFAATPTPSTWTSPR
jgi:UDP-N-acetyl-D-mannosaminuronate dehydrogenase